MNHAPLGNSARTLADLCHWQWPAVTFDALSSQCSALLCFAFIAFPILPVYLVVVVVVVLLLLLLVTVRVADPL